MKKLHPSTVTAVISAALLVTITSLSVALSPDAKPSLSTLATASHSSESTPVQ